MKSFFTGLFLLIAVSVNAADVRFSNNTSLGLNGYILSPHNGNSIKVRNPNSGTWVDVAIPNSGVTGVVSNTCVSSVCGVSLPYNAAHLAFLEMDAAGSLFVNWRPLASVYYVHGPFGFYVDNMTGYGHLIGMAIRRPGVEIQGQYNSQLLISWYNRGHYNFFSIPACTVSAPATWQPCGVPVEVLLWADDGTNVTAALNFTGTVANSSLQGALSVNGSLWSFTAASNALPGNPYAGVIAAPLAGFGDGDYVFQILLQTNAGSVILGAALNSSLNVYSPF